MLFNVEIEKKCQQKIEFKNQRLCWDLVIIEHIATQKGYWRYDCLNVQLEKGDLTELVECRNILLQKNMMKNLISTSENRLWYSLVVHKAYILLSYSNLVL